MSTAMKVTLAAGVVAASSLAWFMGEREVARVQSERVQLEHGEPASAPASNRSSETPADDVRRLRWAGLRTAILATRAQRESASTGGDDSGAAGASVRSPSYSEKQALLSRLYSEATETIFSCVTDHADSGARGTLVFDLHILGEPDIGAVVDDVQPVDDTAKDPALAACLVEGAPAFVFEPVPYSVDQTFRFLADLESQSLGFMTEIEVDDIDAYLADQGASLSEEERRKARAYLQDHPRVPQVLSVSLTRSYGPMPDADEVDASRQELEQRLSDLMQTYALSELWH